MKTSTSNSANHPAVRKMAAEVNAGTIQLMGANPILAGVKIIPFCEDKLVENMILQVTT